MSVWCCSRELKYAATRFLAPRQMFYVPAQFVDWGCASPSFFLSHPTHFFLIKMCSFTGACCCQTCHKFQKQTRGALGPSAKNTKITTALKKTRNAPSAFSNAGGIVNWHPSEAVLLQRKKKVNDPTPSWSAVPCCGLSYQNDIRQDLVISMFSCITSEKHVRLKNVRGHGTVSFFFLGSQNKEAATHVPVGHKRTTTVGVLTCCWRGRGKSLTTRPVATKCSFPAQSCAPGLAPNHPSRHLSTLAFSHIEIVISDGFSSLCKRHKPFRWSAALLHTSFQHTPICGHSHEHECEA